ncbi:MAG: pyruvate, phosphate dikinase [bacterium]
MVVLFGDCGEETHDRLGLKGASLCMMTRAGLPVPHGFVITTDVCREFFERGELPAEAFRQVGEKLGALEELTGLKFGGADRPLLLSVRAGASVLMPGMMDTILNLGLNDDAAAGLARTSNNPAFALDCHRRFIQNFGEVVFGIDRKLFARILEGVKKEAGVESEHRLDEKNRRKLVQLNAKLVRRQSGGQPPDDPMEQLRLAVHAVFRSWESPRAVTYRNLYRIPHHLGTAVTVQAMVFGNLGDDSAAGLVTTRDPTTGEKRLFGEYLVNAQGDDVLSGVRTPRRIRNFKNDFPDLHQTFIESCEALERRCRDMQEIEFTIERGKLYFLQSRESNRTAAAAVRIAVEMVKEGLIPREEAMLRIRPDTLDQILHRYIDPEVQARSIARGVPSSPGAASGRVVFDQEGAERARQTGEDAILVRNETTTEDVRGLALAQGVLTARGGKTSHAAVVVRGMGKPCITGCEALNVNTNNRTVVIGELVVREDDLITIDGSTGRVFLGAIPLRKAVVSPEFRELLSWADEIRTLRVRANVDTPEDAARAVAFGAEGVGLCRTEQMFMTADRLPTVRSMIMAEKDAERERHLNALQKMHMQDFLEIFETMLERPVTFRLLDPPLHEFLPPLDSVLMEAAVMRSQGIAGEELEKQEIFARKVMSLKEANPMLGLRGCRLGILNPEITRMQVTAIFEAACAMARRGVAVRPEIMIPFVGHVNEVKRARAVIVEVADYVMRKHGASVAYAVGVLIEVPRAALTADEIAPEVDFFSFGTNDLTQNTFGMSRDDAESKFLYFYLDQGILEDNPFDAFDEKGVGRLIGIAVDIGRRVNGGLVIGLCGEHAADFKTVLQCHKLGMDYVSCSIFRLPAARLSAARAKLLSDRDGTPPPSTKHTETP